MHTDKQKKISCKKAGEWISLVIDGELSVNDTELLNAHLGGCPACRALKADLEKTVAAAGALGEEFPPELHTAILQKVHKTDQSPAILRPTRGQRLRRITARAASLAAALLVVAGVALALGSRGMIRAGKDQEASMPDFRSYEITGDKVLCYSLKTGSDEESGSYDSDSGAKAPTDKNSDVVIKSEPTPTDDGTTIAAEGSGTGACLWFMENDGTFLYRHADGSESAGDYFVKEDGVIVLIFGDEEKITFLRPLADGQLGFVDGYRFWEAE